VKYSIVTFGCRVNHADSLRIEEDLRARGGVEAGSSLADLVIVNTCSVTATADQGARQTIRRIARENPGAEIVATGCYATRCEGEVAALPNVVRVVRNADKLEIGRSFDGDGPCGAPIEPGIAGRTAFTIRAQTGCEEHCAYCIIPSTRGRAHSLPLDDLVAEDMVNHAAGPQGRNGLREILTTIEHDLGPVTYEQHHLIGDGDLVAQHVTLHGTHRASTMPLLADTPATGRTTTWTFIHIWRVVDGLIVEHWACRDDMGLLEQVRDR